MTIIAGTGHRPHRLGGYTPEVFNRLVALATASLTPYQVEHVISGMALGWDQALAQAAINLNIPFHAYVPFRGMDYLWHQDSRNYFQDLLGRAEKVVICSPGGYAPTKLYTRNQQMVDNCTLLLALWSGGPGGTRNCIRYANAKGRKIVNVWDAWEAQLPSYHVLRTVYADLLNHR